MLMNTFQSETSFLFNKLIVFISHEVIVHYIKIPKINMKCE